MNNRSFLIKAHGCDIQIPVTRVHTLVIGSGASGLNCAIQLVNNGIRGVLILTEGLAKGTSINTGSDKQTYYKLSVCGADADSPRDMAETYFAAGSMHGDLALIEASLSIRAFMHLVNIGVPFPRDQFGQFVGYKTDHDPRQRATSIGPYTSREMCLRLIELIQRLGIPVCEGRTVIHLLTQGQGDARRAIGAVAIDPDGKFEVFISENVVFAVGGPGGLYRTSVYPEVHTGAIGVALLAGAEARSLPESQYGLASTKFRWNVSGTYMQVIPRLISTDATGEGEPVEFLPPYFPSIGEMNGKVFLKGYQWPFDARKVIGGSSIVDILVYIETVIKGRRVFLDFQANPQGFTFEGLPAEAREYLTRSQALQSTPIERLYSMNPGAVELYREHGIDLTRETLEIAVCAQHNNGGLAGNIWWESTNLKHLFPIGEVNGSHGIARPGGSALNAGQVGGFRAAEYIANCYSAWSLSEEDTAHTVQEQLQGLADWAEKCQAAPTGCDAELDQLQERMTRSGSHIRVLSSLDEAAEGAWQQFNRLEGSACRPVRSSCLQDAFQVRQLCFAQAVYLDAIRYAVHSGSGSRGSAIVVDPSGVRIHDLLDSKWKIQPEGTGYREQVLETTPDPSGSAAHHWVARRPIPEIDSWFETTWARFRSKAIYRSDVD